MLDRIYKSSGNPKAGAYRWPVALTVTGTNPAANTECADVVTAGKLWLLRSYQVTCVQGLTQTPLTSLIIKDVAGNTLLSYPGTSSAQNSSVTLAMRWSTNLPLTAGGAATTATAPMDNFIYVPEGYTIGTSTAGIGANTNHGAPIIFVYEYSLDG